jgi:hypothetical protein
MGYGEIDGWAGLVGVGMEEGGGEDGPHGDGPLFGFLGWPSLVVAFLFLTW